MKKISVVAAVALLAGIVCAHAEDIVAPQPPPADLLEDAPPLPGPQVLWKPGHWRWFTQAWSWTGGEYIERPYPGADWIPGHWAPHPDGWLWVEGHWR
jgi:hypothetical protein